MSSFKNQYTYQKRMLKPFKNKKINEGILILNNNHLNMINKINNEVIKIPNTGIVKYHVKLKFEVDGLVEKADIIGAIFGQTEGLLGPEMNLNELQKVSKVGRIEVNVDSKSNSARGDALIPMSTDIQPQH